MSVNNLLPIGNSTNWGQQINAILQNMDNRIRIMEERLISDDTASYITNLGYAGSGVVGKPTTLTCGYRDQDDQYILTFNGKVYVSGEANIYGTINNSFYIDTIDVSNGYNYVYLYYNNDDSELFINRFEIEVSTTFSYDWQHILLGVIHHESYYDIYDFIIKIYGSNKTSAQHRDEFYRRWAAGVQVSDIPSFNINTDGNLVLTAAHENTYDLYGDGLDNNNIQNYEYTDMKSITTNSTKVAYVADSTIGSSSYSSSTNANMLDKSNKWNIYRLLVTNDGYTILQRYYTTYNNTSYTFQSASLQGFADLILNLEFNNNITQLLASDFVEIARVALYATSEGLSTISSSGKNYFYIKSHTNGYTPEASMNVSMINSGIMLLDSLLFKNIAQDTFYGAKFLINSYDFNSSPSFIFYCNGDSEHYLLTNKFSNSTITSNITLNSFKVTASNSILELSSSKGLLTATSGNYSYRFGIDKSLSTIELKIKNNTNQGPEITLSTNSITISTPSLTLTSTNAITCNASLNISEGKAITYTSDRRRKENIVPTMTSYLPIVKDTSIVEYKYKNSDIPQLGIIAQDLETWLDDKSRQYFVDIVQDDEIKDKRVLKETKLIYILWKAIQEQQEEIEELKQKLS